MIDLFNKTLFQVTKHVAWLGMLFLLGAMLVTTVDVVLRKVDNQGIYGTIDIIQLMILAAAYLSIPHAFMSRSHVAVSVVSDMFSRRLAAFTQLIATALSCAFMLAIAWHGFAQAMMQHQYGDISITLGIPMIYFWIPVLSGAALSGVVTLHIGAETLYTIITGRGALSPVEEEAS